MCDECGRRGISSECLAHCEYWHAQKRGQAHDLSGEGGETGDSGALCAADCRLVWLTAESYAACAQACLRAAPLFSSPEAAAALQLLEHTEQRCKQLS